MPHRLQVPRDRHGQPRQQQQRQVDATRQRQAAIGAVEAFLLRGGGHTVPAGQFASDGGLLGDARPDEDRPPTKAMIAAKPPTVKARPVGEVIQVSCSPPESRQ